MCSIQAVHSSRASGSLDDQPVADLKDEVEEPAAKEQKERCGVPGMECSVCFNRPVQVCVDPRPQRQQCARAEPLNVPWKRVPSIGEMRTSKKSAQYPLFRTVKESS